ncbi:MAG: (d)CMP kinase [Hyphomonadaceae bacterium]|jgi:cytidylate kinase|nr:(d)CMP kinase [Hyphomonadaceae bacterium]
MIIAIDGPLASGKGTIARALAATFGLPYLDTGTLYRAVALAMTDTGHAPEETDRAIEAARNLEISLTCDPRIRTAAIGAGASVVAAIPEVRQALFAAQREFALQPGGAVLDGRDIGTVVCPEADVKIFVTADVETRARRRQDELAASGEMIGFDAMLEQLRIRDARDSGRADAPLAMAEDAHLLDTSTMSIDAAVNEARAIVEAKQGGSG